MKLSTNDFDFHKERKYMSAELSQFKTFRFPEHIDLTSSHTGRTVRFEIDTDSFWDNEGWDGMMMEYIPTVPLANCEKLVLFND